MSARKRLHRKKAAAHRRKNPGKGERFPEAKERELQEAIEKMQEARRRFDAEKEWNKKKRQAGDDLQFWGNKAAYLYGWKKSAKGNPLFTRRQKRKMKQRTRHAIRSGVLRLFGIKQKPIKFGRVAGSHRGTRKSGTQPPPAAGLRGEVIEALRGQGYSKSVAVKMVPSPSSGDDFQSLFKRALKRNPGARRNAAQSLDAKSDREAEKARKVFRDFHGTDRADKVYNVIRNMVEQGKYALLGRLYGYDLKELPRRWIERDGRRIQAPNVDTWAGNIMLCSDPDARQLFVWGGDQDLEWAIKPIFHIDSDVQFPILGTIDRLWYITEKAFHKFNTETYVHRMGEKCREDCKIKHRHWRVPAGKPLLMYDRKNKQQWIVGGDYQIKPEGIAN